MKASDLEGDVTVRIDRVIVEKMENSKDEKPVVYFRGAEKALVLNVTNGNTIAEAYGDETDNWRGHAVTLYRDMTDFQGRRVDCIRVRIPSVAPVTATSQSETVAPPAMNADSDVGDGAQDVDAPF